MPNTYETVMVIKPTIEEDQVNDVVELVKKLLKKSKATILHEDNWGKKRLAYEIKKYKRAYYYLLNFQATPEVLKKLERHYQLSEDIIRHITVTLKTKTSQSLQTELLKKKEKTTTQEDNDGSKPE